jgi:hypothetical protein
MPDGAAADGAVADGGPSSAKTEYVVGFGDSGEARRAPTLDSGYTVCEPRGLPVIIGGIVCERCAPNGFCPIEDQPAG